MNDNVLFALLRLGLGTNKDIQKENISDLFLATEKQWEQLLETARFQGVSGVVLDGLQVIINDLDPGCFSRSFSPDKWKMFILQLIGEVQQVYEGGNYQQLVVIDTIQRKWVESGIRMMVIK